MGSQSNIKREGEEQATGEEPVMLPDVTVSAPKPKQSLCFNHELGGFGGGEIKEEEPRYGRWGGQRGLADYKESLRQEGRGSNKRRVTVLVRLHQHE